MSYTLAGAAAQGARRALVRGAAFVVALALWTGVLAFVGLLRGLAVPLTKAAPRG